MQHMLYIMHTLIHMECKFESCKLGNNWYISKIFKMPLLAINAKKMKMVLQPLPRYIRTTPRPPNWNWIMDTSKHIWEISNNHIAPLLLKYSKKHYCEMPRTTMVRPRTKKHDKLQISHNTKEILCISLENYLTTTKGK